MTTQLEQAWELAKQNPDSEIAHYVAQIHSTRQTKELCA